MSLCITHEHYRLGGFSSLVRQGSHRDACSDGPVSVQMQAEPEAKAVRALFRDVIPALLGHRLAPLAMCNATVVSEFRRLASRLRLLDDSVCAAGAAGG